MSRFCCLLPRWLPPKPAPLPPRLAPALLLPRLPPLLLAGAVAAAPSWTETVWVGKVPAAETWPLDSAITLAAALASAVPAFWLAATASLKSFWSTAT